MSSCVTTSEVEKPASYGHSSDVKIVRRFLGFLANIRPARNNASASKMSALIPRSNQGTCMES
jgi:hypothetical protein